MRAYTILSLYYVEPPIMERDNLAIIGPLEHKIVFIVVKI